MEKSSSERVLVVESDDALRSSIVGALSDAGYEVSIDYREGMKFVLKFSPDAVVLGANSMFSAPAFWFRTRGRSSPIITWLNLGGTTMI